MSCPSCYETNSPEIVPVTLSQTVINIDNSPAMHRSEVFEYGDDANHRTFCLAYFPYEPRSVQVFRNSGAQIYGIDFTVQGQYVVLTVPLIDSADKIFVTYLHVAGSIPSQVSSVGSIVASAGTELEGFYQMDGTTTHTWALCQPLHTWFYENTSNGEPGLSRRNSLLLSNDGTNFVLKMLQDTAFDGTTLVTLNKFISLGAGA